jgi:Alginate export
MVQLKLKTRILMVTLGVLSVSEISAQLRRKPIAPVKAAKPAAVIAPVAAATPSAPVVTAPAAPAASTQEKWYDSVKISGMIRVRPEIKDNFAFDADQKYNFVGQKVWLTAEKEFADKSKAVITLQDVRIWGGQNPSITDTGTERQATDIREAYLNLKNFLWSPFDLKVGRQKLEYGEQMLVGSLDWANVGRSFDGAKLIWDTEKNNLQIFSTFIQGSRSNDLNNAASPLNTKNMYFSGIYNAWKIHRAFKLDTYVFARNEEGTDRHANQLYTAGIRLSNRTDPGNKTPEDMLIDYSIDVAYQGGRYLGQEIEAYAAVGFLGVSFSTGSTVRMRFGGQGAYASGDNDSSDGKYQTFDPLYPTPHYQFGQADMTSWRNLTGAGVDYTIWFGSDFSIKLDYWYAMRTSTSDYWYAIGGAANATTSIASLGGEKELYQEGGVLINYKARHFLGFQAGYAYAMRGKAMNAANKSGDYQFAYLMSTLMF